MAVTGRSATLAARALSASRTKNPFFLKFMLQHAVMHRPALFLQCFEPGRTAGAPCPEERPSAQNVP